VPSSSIVGAAGPAAILFVAIGVLANESNEVIEFLAHVFLNRGDDVITSQYALIATTIDFDVFRHTNNFSTGNPQRQSIMDGGRNSK
jgi:hypothetical protein